MPEEPEGEPYIVVDKPAMTLMLMAADGTLIQAYPIACGIGFGNKTRRGDHKTPEGTFPINEILASSSIPHDFRDGKGPIVGAYGPWFLRLDVPGYWDIGIHGTHLPESIGTRTTEGCIRLRNKDILDLKSRIHLGTKVTILPDIE